MVVVSVTWTVIFHVGILVAVAVWNFKFILLLCSCTNISWRRCSSRSNSKSIDLPLCKIMFLCTRAILVILSVPLSLDWFYFHDVLNTRRLHEQQLQLVSRADERVLRNPQPSQAAATRAWRFTASQGLHLIMIRSSLAMFFSQKVTDFYILQMDKFHFPGPRCGFYMSKVGKPPCSLWLVFLWFYS